MYHRTNSADVNSCSRKARVDLEPGYEIRVRAARLSGSSIVVTTPNGSSLFIRPTYTPKAPEGTFHGIDCGNGIAENIIGKYDCGEE
jgi:hypothetical protein